MRHRVDTRKLGRPSGHRRSMMKNFAISLVMEERIVTTVARAKEVRRLVERLITRAKRGSLHDRRIVAARLNHKDATKKLFDELAPRYATRPGGYTRIVKAGNRQSDGAPTAVIELVQ